MAPGGDSALHHAKPDNRERRRGAAHDHVILRDNFRQRPKLNRFSAEPAGKRRSFLKRAVRHRHFLRMLRAEVRRAELDHFTGTDEEHILIGEAAEKRVREPDTGRGERHRVRADRGRRTDFLCRSKGTVKKMPQHQPERLRFAGNTPGLLHLAHNLRFAEHHGVEAARHTERVTGHIRLAVLVGVRKELLQVNALLPRNKAAERMQRGITVFCRKEELSSVAGRQNQRFPYSALFRTGIGSAERRKRSGNLFRRECHRFPDGKRGRRMV